MFLSWERASPTIALRKRQLAQLIHQAIPFLHTQHLRQEIKSKNARPLSLWSPFKMLWHLRVSYVDTLQSQ